MAHETLRRIGSILLLVGIVFFVLKFSIGVIIDNILPEFSITILNVILLVKVSDLIVLIFDLFFVRKFFSFR